jgi:hypothetical protein
MSPFDSFGSGEGRHIEQERIPEIRIESAIEYFEADRDLLIERLAQNLQSRTNRGVDMWDEVSVDDMRPKAVDQLAEMEKTIELNRERIRLQVVHCFDLVRQKEYRVGTSDIFILIYPEGLANMIPFLEEKTLGIPGYFDPYNGWVTLDPETSNRTIAHETGHAISHKGKDSEGWEEVGFSKMRKTEDDSYESIGFQHYDEGVTMLWEEYAGLDGERLEDAGIYEWLRKLVGFQMNEAGISFDELMSANFGGGEAMEQFNEKIKQRFGMTLVEMDPLRLLLFKPFELTEKVLLGEEIEIPFGDRDGREYPTRQAGLLKRRFPNAKFSAWPNIE